MSRNHTGDTVGYGNIPGWYYTTILGNAAKRKLRVSISIQDIDTLFTQQLGKCFFTGASLRFNSARHRSDGSHIKNTSASLDRIDSRLGYVLGNLRWVHKHINISKLDYTDIEYLSICHDHMYNSIPSDTIKTFTINAAVWNAIVNKVKWRYNGRTIEFDKKYLEKQLIKQGGRCAITGRLIEFPASYKNHRLSLGTASIDRIDSEVGYVEGNIQILHKDVNMCKQSFDNKYFSILLKTAFLNRYYQQYGYLLNSEYSMMISGQYVITQPPETYFLDLDGTLIFHQSSLDKMLEYKMRVLPGVYKQLKHWKDEGAKIIITTARPEFTRGRTCAQLATAKIYYDELIMGLTNGPRVLINDNKPQAGIEKTARAITVPRNSGFLDFPS